VKKTAHVVWTGSIKEGGGLVSTETGVLRDAPYGFNSRFEGGKGTNPEELIAAAHASCFSMALALAIGEAGLVATRITTDAAITLEKGAAGYEITGSHLAVVALVPGANAAQFEALANKTKTGCPVSKLLRAPITMTATLA
jgi:osmotically inducible protein OsmC